MEELSAINWEAVGAEALVYLIALSVIVKGVQALAHKLDRYARNSPSKRDDKPAARFAKAADTAASVLDAVARFIPVIRQGRK